MKDTNNFKKIVLSYWRKNGRHTLLWRQTNDPYAILVSEIMLQQTQVDRVTPYFEKWMKEFPTVQKLADAPLSDVLKVWSGLGYNRRAKLLRACAQAIVESHKGEVPMEYHALVALPAIGPYTAGAIRAFAFNERGVFIETNIRAALIHHFFPTSKKVRDNRLAPILDEIVKSVKSPRDWYSALMDYGAHVKKKYPNPSRRSIHHTKQSTFTGSLRQARGAILRTLVTGPANEIKLRKQSSSDYYKKALTDLAREEMIEKKGGKWQLVEK